ncbi:MAG: alpha/beta fold hydrolase [candidate division FCPU426 bacterium]
MRKKLLGGIFLALAVAFSLFNVVAWEQGRRASHILPQHPAQSGWDRALFGAYTSKRKNDPLPWPAMRTKVLGWQGSKLDLVVVEKAKGAPLVVLLHGYLDNKTLMFPIASELLSRGYSVAIPDFHGHGDSEGWTTSMGYHEAEDVVAVTRFARELLAPRSLAIYGVSMGGAAACRALGSLSLTADALVLDGVYDRFANAVAHTARLQGLPVWPTATLAAFWIGQGGGYNAFAVDPAQWAKGISVPCLVMVGTADNRVSVEETKRIFESLAGPKRLALIPGAGHAELYDHFREPWRESVLVFLKAYLR